MEVQSGIGYSNGLAIPRGGGSTKANGREPKSCLSRVFNFKLGCIVMYTIAQHIQARPSLELKTRPRFRPLS
jgi:hypothetical protein